MERFFANILLKRGGMLAAFIELGRPWNGVIVALLTIVGAMLAIQAVPPAFFIMVGALATFIVYTAATILNDVYDIEPDKINMPYRPLERGSIAKSTAIRMSFFLYIIAILGSFAVSPVYFVSILVMSLVSVTYSLPPFSAKDRGFLGNIVLGVSMIFTSMYAGYALVTNSMVPSYEFLIVLSLFTASFCLISVLKDLKDIYGDRINKKLTFAVRHDKNISVLVSFVGTAILFYTMYLIDLYFIRTALFLYTSFAIVMLLVILELVSYKKFSIEMGEKTWAFARIILMFLALSIFTFSFFKFA